jgi:hypothetical protein
MTLIALILSLLVVAFGALGIVSPLGLLNIVRRFESLGGLYTAAAFRIVLGVALFYAAPTSHAPEILRILGMVILVAGLITPFIGLKRFRKLVHWWSSQGLTFIRMWAVLAFVFGLFLAYAVVT